MIDLSLEQDAPEGATLFTNDAWSVLGDGLEHRATGYFIARSALAARRGDGLWEWPLHLAEKSWCQARPLREAFGIALDHFGIERDDQLSRSFAVGFGIRTEAGGPADRGFVALGEVVRPKPAEQKRSTKAPAHQAREKRRVAA